MVGDVTGNAALKGVAFASGASPAPKVFTSVRGYEALSTRFTLVYEDEHGARAMRIEPHAERRLRGPYNRRNVYGAALAFGPVLPAGLRDPVLQHAVCRDPRVIAELGVVLDGRTPVQLHYRGRTGDLPPITVDCGAVR